MAEKVENKIKKDLLKTNNSRSIQIRQFYIKFLF
jgi:hypothetical protein